MAKTKNMVGLKRERVKGVSGLTTEPIFFSPVLQERIWGGQKLAQFGYDLPSLHTGECWGISAHPNGLSTVRNGLYKGKSLLELWENHAELFGGNTKGSFPLLVKVLDASADLSVQVHPNDAQAAQLEENEAYGKTECWYVIEAEENAELILGHTAKSEAEFNEKIEAGEWNELFHRIPIRSGDFFHVPSGTIHAIGAGTLILETQQSSDTTYRVYDFDRTDEKGNKRQLHLEKAKQVTQIPDRKARTNTKTVRKDKGCTITELIASPYFTVYHGQITSYWNAAVEADYLLVSVIKGSGELTVRDKSFPLKKGDHLLLPVDATTFEIHGELDFIASHA
ncbi:mannose-6-phosphate isomerase [Bacillus sp. JCM 19047]|nr:mannose-6-phosphate isomerase [Bacillus sp. JCM 19047]